MEPSNIYKEQLTERLYEIEKSVSLCTLCEDQVKPTCWQSSQQSSKFVPSLPCADEESYVLDEADRSIDLVTAHNEKTIHVTEQPDKTNFIDIQPVTIAELNKTSFGFVTQSVKQCNEISNSFMKFFQQTSKEKSEVIMPNDSHNVINKLSAKRLSNEQSKISLTTENDTEILSENRIQKVQEYLTDMKNNFWEMPTEEPTKITPSPFQCSDGKTESKEISIIEEITREAPRCYNSDILDNVIPTKKAKIIENKMTNGFWVDKKKIVKTTRKLPKIVAIEDLNTNNKIIVSNNTKTIRRSEDLPEVTLMHEADAMFKNEMTKSLEIPIAPELNIQKLLEIRNNEDELATDTKKVTAKFEKEESIINDSQKIPLSPEESIISDSQKIPISPELNMLKLLEIRNKEDKSTERMKQKLITRVNTEATEKVIPVIDVENCEASASSLENKRTKDRKKTKLKKHHLSNPEIANNTEIPLKQRRLSNTWANIENVFINPQDKSSLSNGKSKYMPLVTISPPSVQKLQTKIAKQRNHLIKSNRFLHMVEDKIRNWRYKLNEILLDSDDIKEECTLASNIENVDRQSVIVGGTGNKTVGGTKSATVRGTGSATVGGIGSATVGGTGSATFGGTGSATLGSSSNPLKADRTEQLPIAVEPIKVITIGTQTDFTYLAENSSVNDKKKTEVMKSKRDSLPVLETPKKRTKIKLLTVDSATARAHEAIFNANFDEFSRKKRKL